MIPGREKAPVAFSLGNTSGIGRIQTAFSTMTVRDVENVFHSVSNVCLSAIWEDEKMRPLFKSLGILFFSAYQRSKCDRLVAEVERLRIFSLFL